MVNRGIVVDDHLQVPTEAIYVLGDCAEIEGRMLPFVLPIMQAGRSLAKIRTAKMPKSFSRTCPWWSTPSSIRGCARCGRSMGRCAILGQGIKMGFFNRRNQMTGFAISGEFIGERNERPNLACHYLTDFPDQIDAYRHIECSPCRCHVRCEFQLYLAAQSLAQTIRRVTFRILASILVKSAKCMGVEKKFWLASKKWSHCNRATDCGKGGFAHRLFVMKQSQDFVEYGF